jgi:hypothetical protein
MGESPADEWEDELDEVMVPLGRSQAKGPSRAGNKEASSNLASGVHSHSPFQRCRGLSCLHSASAFRDRRSARRVLTMLGCGMGCIALKGGVVER